jgi:hypothetical protein
VTSVPGGSPGLVEAESGKYTRNVVGVPSLTETAASGSGETAKQRQEDGPKHSGKLLVRMPATLHDELAQAAETEGVSLNQWITGALASAVGWKGSGEPPARAVPDSSKAADAEPKPMLSPRTTRIALLANLVVLVIAGAAAIALLIAALQSGF